MFSSTRQAASWLSRFIPITLVSSASDGRITASRFVAVMVPNASSSIIPPRAVIALREWSQNAAAEAYFELAADRLCKATAQIFLADGS